METKLTPSQLPLSTQVLEASLKTFKDVLKRTGNQAAKIKEKAVSEDALFLSVIHARLQQSAPSMANALYNRVANAYKNLVKAGKENPLFRIVDNFLRKAVEDGKLTRTEKRSMMMDAAGKAQLDGNNKDIDQKITKKQDKPGSLSAVATAALAKEKLTGKEIVTIRQNVFKDDPRKALPADPIVSNDLATIHSPPSDVLIGLDKADLRYRPICEAANGCAEVLIPAVVAGDVKGVFLENESGERVSFQYKETFVEDGRAKWISDGSIPKTWTTGLYTLIFQQHDGTEEKEILKNGAWNTFVTQFA